MAIKLGLSRRIPPAGSEPYCAHGDIETLLYNSFGGGHSVYTVTLDCPALYDVAGCANPCGNGAKTIDFKFDLADPCGGCGDQIEFSYYLPSELPADEAEILADFPNQWAMNGGFGLVNASVEACVITFVLCRPGTVMGMTVALDPALYVVAEVVDPLCPVVPLGSGGCITVGRAVTQSLSSPYYSTKTAHLPQGGVAPDEVFAGLTMANMVHTLKDGDSTCCGCNCYPACRPMCVKQKGCLAVDLAAPITNPAATAGYINDPTLETNGMIVEVLDPAAPPAGVEVIAGSKFMEAKVGDVSAIVCI